MTAKNVGLDERLHAYMLDTMLREDPILRALREETARMPDAQMQIGPEQGQFMQMLARVMHAKKYLEIGVFTGYSSLALAQALPAGGRVVACDVSPEYTAIARRYWERAGVAGKIDLRLGPALDTLDDLLAHGEQETFDLAFVDADKANADLYYERCLRLLRSNGVLLVDNVFWSGKILDASVNDADTTALRAINAKAGKDDRVDATLLPICDGILMVRKR